MKKVFVLFAVLFVFSAKNVVATHIMGADITYKTIDTLKFEFTFSMYRDCRGIAMPPWPVNVRCLDKSISRSMGTLSTSTRSIEDITPICATQSSCGSSQNQGFGSKGIEKHTYKMTLDFKSSTLNQFVTGGCCWVRVETSQNARNGAITSGPSGNVYTYADVNLCKSNGVNNSPTLISQPLAYLCCNQPASLSLGGKDYIEGDSLSYAWSNPMRGYNQNTSYSGNYSYYQPFQVYYPGSLKYPYNNPNASPPIGLYLNEKTGDFVFTPTKCDEVTVAVLEVKEWRRINGKMEHIGTTRRDMQFESFQCPANNPPKIKSNPVLVFDFDACDSIVEFIVSTEDKKHTNTGKNIADTVGVFVEELPKNATARLVDSSARQPQIKITWKPDLKDTGSYKRMQFVVIAKDDACPYNAYSQRTITAYVRYNQSSTKVNTSVFHDSNKNCVQDATDKGMGYRSIQGRSSKDTLPFLKYRTDSNGFYQLCTNADSFNIHLFDHPFYDDVCSDTTFKAKGRNSHDINFGSNYKKNSVTGVVTYDFDKSCHKNGKDHLLNGVKIVAQPGNIYTTTDGEGRYLLPLPNGSYKISVGDRDLKESCNTQHSVTINNSKIFLNKDFHAYLDSGNLVLFGIVTREGSLLNRSASLFVVSENYGHDTLKNVKVKITFPKGASIDTSFNSSKLNDSTLELSINILPFKQTKVKIPFKLSGSNFKIRDEVIYRGEISSTLSKKTDRFTDDNSFKIKRRIRRSYDPNIKQTDEDSIITAFDSTLNYTIHFQNTGTAPAYYVELRDTLPKELEEGSFEFLGSSHEPVNFILQNRILYFIFDDIELADSTSDEEASKGFVKFKIKPKQGFIQDTSIRNNVSIYFDLNEPVKTADQVNTIKSPISVKPVTKAYYCAGDTVELGYFTRYSPASGNAFDFVLSDGTGDFTNGQVLKTISSNAQKGKEVIILPKDLTKGSNYQFRMKGSHQWAITFESDYSNAFEVVQNFDDTLVLTNTEICTGSDIPLDLKQKKATKFRLFSNGVAIDSNAIGYWPKLNVQAGDDVYVESSENGRCPVSSDTAVFNFHYLPVLDLVLDTFNCGNTNLKVANGTTSTDPIDQLDVSWGDGTSDDIKGLATANHNYSSTGRYSLKAIATTSFGCEDSVEYSVVIADQPEAKFTLPASTCLADSVSFSHSSSVVSGSIDSILWTTSNGSNIDNEFKELMPADGVHSIQLIVGSDLGCFDTLTHTIKAFENPVANFDITELSACFNTNAFEIDLNEGLSKYTITQQDWTYEGQTSTSSTQINHSFAASGDYEISLAIQDENGCTATDTQTIQVLDYLPAVFDVNTLVQCLNSNHFTPISYNDGSTFANAVHGWEISDGGSYSNASFNHQFVTTGTYNIVHTTELDVMCRDTFELEVTVNPNPEVEFSAVDVCEGEESVFVNESTIAVVVDDEQWDFEVSQENFNTAQTEVRNTFPTAGVYQVQCIQGALGCFDTSSISHTVNALPQISVDYEVISTGIITVEFTNNSLGGGTETVWDFGDGTAPITTTNKVVQHDYRLAGEYVITITETSPETCVQTAQITVDAIGEIIFLIPTAFSPNKDGFNDEFNIVDPNLIEALHIELFDRWGSKVAESDRKSDIFRDADLTTGVYLYELKITDIFGMNHYHKGSIVVVE